MATDASRSAEPRPVGDTPWLLVRSVVREQRGQAVRLVVWSMVESTPSLFSGLFVSAALDRGFLAHRFGIGLAILAGYAAIIGVGAVGSRQAVPALANLVEALRFDLVLRSVRAVLVRGFAGEAVGGRDVEAATKHTEQFRLMVSQLLLAVRLAIFSLLFTLAGLFLLAPLVGWFALITAVVVLLILVLTAPGWQRAIREALIAEERLSEHAGRTLGGLRDVVALGASDRAEHDLGVDVDTHARLSERIGPIVASRVALITLGGRLPIIGLLIAGPFAVAHHVLTPGQLLGAALYLVGGIEPTLRALVLVAGEVGLNAGVLLERLVHYCRPPAPAEPGAPVARRTMPGTDGVTPTRIGPLASGPAPRGPRPEPVGYAVTLSGVRFAYSEASDPVLDDVDLHIGAGERIAIVGPSGVGKSTLADLLVGLDRPRQGNVRIAGVDLGTLSPEWLRGDVVLLPQDAYVFAGPIRDNLAYLRTDVTDDELVEACHAVGADQIVAQLGGLDGTLGSAAQLSEGQKQLVTLVRAYVTRAKIVVLDEATCHLHPYQERRVEEAFAATGRTVVVIAHRMSSAIRADRVALLHGGMIEIGTHPELVERAPLYADMVGHWNEV